MSCSFKGRMADMAALHGIHHVFQKSRSRVLPLYLFMIKGKICLADILGSMSIMLYTELELAVFIIAAIFSSEDFCWDFKSSLSAKSNSLTISLAILSRAAAICCSVRRCLRPKERLRRFPTAISSNNGSAAIYWRQKLDVKSARKE